MVIMSLCSVGSLMFTVYLCLGFFFSCWPFTVCFPAKQGLACSSWWHAHSLQEKGMVYPAGLMPHAGCGLAVFFGMGKRWDSPQGSHGTLDKKE